MTIDCVIPSSGSLGLRRRLLHKVNVLFQPRGAGDHSCREVGRSQRRSSIGCGGCSRLITIFATRVSCWIRIGPLCLQSISRPLAPARDDTKFALITTPIIEKVCAGSSNVPPKGTEPLTRSTSPDLVAHKRKHPALSWPEEEEERAGGFSARDP